MYLVNLGEFTVWVDRNGICIRFKSIVVIGLFGTWNIWIHGKFGCILSRSMVVED